MIQLSNVFKSYYLGDREESVLKGIDLTIQEGEMVALMGPSGSGKSTLMNIVGLLDHPTSGQYLLDQSDVSSFKNDELAGLRNKTIGFVFQSFHLLPRMSARQNVSLPLVYRNIPIDQRKKQSMAELKKMGLESLWFHKPNELSGGQQQRVAIARALVGAPKILLADEPTGALDHKTGQEIMDLLIDINKKEGTTMMLVTHDQEVADQCSRVIRLFDGKVQS